MSVPMRWESDPLPVSPGSPSQMPLRRRRPTRRSSLWRMTLISGLVLSVCGVGIASARNLWRGLGAAATLQLQDSRSKGEVALDSASVDRRLNYVTVTGSVVSRSARPLPHVEAVVELLDGQNKVVRMESALIAFDPLPNGESAPFQVELPDDSRAVGYRVRFKQLMGAALN